MSNVSHLSKSACLEMYFDLLLHLLLSFVGRGKKKAWNKEILLLITNNENTEIPDCVAYRLSACIVNKHRDVDLNYWTMIFLFINM